MGEGLNSDDEGQMYGTSEENRSPVVWSALAEKKTPATVCGQRGKARICWVRECFKKMVIDGNGESREEVFEATERFSY